MIGLWVALSFALTSFESAASPALPIVSPLKLEQKITQTQSASGLTVIAITSQECSSCQEVHPTLEKTAEKYRDQVTFFELTLDNEATANETRQFAKKYDAKILPVLLLFKNGKFLEKLEDFTPVSQLENHLEKLLSKQIALELKDCEGIVRLLSMGITPKEPPTAIPTKDCPDCQAATEYAQTEYRSRTFAQIAALLRDPDLTSFQNDTICNATVTLKPHPIPGVTHAYNPAKNGLHISQLRYQRIFSIGEGAGTPLVPYLNKYQIDAWGIDIDYPGEILSKGHYVLGDATRLSSLPIAQKKPKHVVSANLLCELESDQIQKTLIESIQVLPAGGSSRHFFFTFEKTKPGSPEFRSLLQNVQTWAKSQKISIQIYTAEGSITRPDRPEPLETFLLVIERSPQAQ